MAEAEGLPFEAETTRSSRPARILALPLRLLLAKLLIALAACWLGWQIITNTAADSLADGAPETALRWSPEHAAALVSYVDRAMDSVDRDDRIEDSTAKPPIDPDAVIGIARRALASDPLEAGALRLLALAADVKGDAGQANALMTLALKRSRRDIRVEGWLLDRRLADGDIDGALESADAMLRAWPSVDDYILPVLVALAGDPSGITPLVALLQKNPPWRSWFMEAYPPEAPSVEALSALYSGLKDGPAPPTTRELDFYLDRLIALQDYSRAYAVLADFSPKERMGTFGNVNNGGFDFPLDGLPFHWSIEKARGAETEVVTEDDDNRALRVRFQSGHVRYAHTSQLLLLRPGDYRLTGKVKPVALRNERGMQWTVSCASGDKQRIAETGRVSGTADWMPFAVDFSVPDNPDCEAQVLRLELAARVESERQISGEIWYDDLAITRIATPQASQ